MRSYYVYVMTNPWRTLYIGVTSDLMRRVDEHKRGVIPGFTSRYALTNLVYFEETINMQAALAREKQLKGWVRRRKVELIEGVNPDWRDLSDDWFGEADPSLRSG